MSKTHRKKFPLKTQAELEARDRKHVMQHPWKKNGDLWVLQCSTCLNYAFVDPDTYRMSGAAIEYGCDPKAENKGMSFDHSDMSPEHRARISGRWKPPSEK